MPRTTQVQLSCQTPSYDIASGRAEQVASLFGLTTQQTATSLGRCSLSLCPGQVVLILGPSGSGKSTLLAALDAQVPTSRADRCPFDPTRSAIDHIPLPLEPALRLLAACGLADARVLAAPARCLSDGQRHRLRLAQAIAQAQQRPGRRVPVVVADEFAAPLDRLTAQLVAASVRKLATVRNFCAVLATSHDDLLDALDPDVLILKPLGPGIQVLTRQRHTGSAA